MKISKKINKIVSLLLVLFTMGAFLTSVPSVYAAHSMKISAKQFLQNKYTGSGISNSEYGLGSYAFYVLNQAGIDVSTWTYQNIAFEDSVSETVYNDITSAASKSAKVLAQDLAAAKTLNLNDYADQLVDVLKARQTATGFDASLFSNVPAFDLLGATGKLNEMDPAKTKAYLLGQQNTTVANDVYSWGFTYGGTYYPDFNTTAKAVRALHYLDPGKGDSDIQDAIDKGLDWMKNQQKEDGSFVAGFAGMDDPLKDTAEAIITLKTLGINVDDWKSGVDKSAKDYLLEKALNEDGSFGKNKDIQDAVLFLYAYSLTGLDSSDKALSIDPSSKTLDYGDQQQFTANQEIGDVVTDVSANTDWSIGDSSVADIVYGLVASKKPGTTVIHAVYDGLTADADLTVKSPLSLDPASKTLTVGQQQQFTSNLKIGTVTTDVTADVTWSVANSNIASIVNGNVRANSAGVTVVNAVYNGFTAAAALTVTAASGGDTPPIVVVSKNVSLAVVGPKGTLLFGPSSFKVQEDNKWGLSVLGALDASGAGYHTSYWDPYGYSVDSVAGQNSNGTGGWMYAINGTAGDKMPADKTINTGDKIVFYWASSMDTQPPTWSDLVKLQENPAAGINLLDTQTSDTVKDSEFSVAIKNADAADEVVIKADDKNTSLALTNDQFSQIVGKGKPLAVMIQGVQVVFEPGKLENTDQLAKDGSKLSFSVEKLSDWSLQNKVTPFSGGLKLAGEVYDFSLVQIDKDGTQQTIEKIPRCKVVLPIPAGVRASAQAGIVMAYWYNEAGKKWDYMGGSYDEKSNTLTFSTNHFSQYALAEATCSFDDINGHWARKEISVMAANGYIKGVNSENFLPDNKITRAEFTAILTRVGNFQSDSKVEYSFYDVPEDAWYRSSVEAAVSKGIVKGVDKDSFAPNNYITRQEMAVMVKRFITYMEKSETADTVNDSTKLDKFSDVSDISSWAKTSVAGIIEDKIMVGRENGTFIPKGNATRAEATVVLYRVLQKLLN